MTCKCSEPHLSTVEQVHQKRLPRSGYETVSIRGCNLCGMLWITRYKWTRGRGKEHYYYRLGDNPPRGGTPQYPQNKNGDYYLLPQYRYREGVLGGIETDGLMEMGYITVPEAWIL